MRGEDGLYSRYRHCADREHTCRRHNLYSGRYLRAVGFHGTCYRQDACLRQLALLDLIPGYLSLLMVSVQIHSRYLLRKHRLYACHGLYGYSLVTQQRILVIALIYSVNRCLADRQSRGGSCQGEGSGFFCRLYDYKGLAVKGRAPRALHICEIGGISVVCSHDASVSADGELDRVVCPGIHHTVFIYDVYLHVAQVFAVCCDVFLLRSHSDGSGIASSSSHVSCDLFSVCVISDCFHSTRLIVYQPLEIQIFLVASVILTGNTGLCLRIVSKLLLAQALAIEEYLDAAGVTVDTDRHLAVDLNAVVILPVPVGQDMYHRLLLHIKPLALEQIEAFLRESTGIDRSKVRALGSTACVGCRFTGIVKACPEEKSAHVFTLCVLAQRIVKGCSPVYTVVVKL